MERQNISRGVLLTSNLPQLQNLIKRDPSAYREEFLQQWNHYESIRKIFQLNPDEQAHDFRQLVSFLSQVAQCYPKETANFPSHISTLLLENYSSLNPDTKKTLVQNLVMLRNKNVITSIELLKTLFPLLPRTTSATLRTFIRRTILSDIRTVNMKAKNHKLNRAVQAMLFGMIERGMDGEVLGDKGKLRANPSSGGAADPATKRSGDEAMWAVVLAKELWKKNIWNDSKTVSIVALGCFHPFAKVQAASLHFFLGSDEEDEESEDEEGPDIKGLQHRREINKKTRSGDKKLMKSIKAVAKKRKEKSSAKDKAPNFPALQLLNDPQTFGEKLYDNLNRYDKRFSLDHKILIMQLLSRVMGAHKLCVLGFYTYIVKYLAYHQLRIPAILVSLAQSVHSLTPPDVLTPVIRKIASEFVHPGVGPEVIAAGINAIREVCRRQPWCIEEDLLSDLVEYKKSRDKGVVTASRGLLQLYREVNPGMLKKRERGKEASTAKKTVEPLPFGHVAEAVVNIEGLELLESHLEKLRTEGGGGDGDEEEDEQAAWEGWEVDSDSTGSESEGWIDVESDGDDLEITDSEDDSPKNKKKEKKSEEENAADDGAAGTSKPTAADEMNRISTLATTKILTPADFALLNDLRIKAAKEAVEAGGGSSTKRKLAALEANKKVMNKDAGTMMNEAFVSEGDILGPRKKTKMDYEERMASIQKGREGRQKFGSSRGKRNKGTPSSTTNREKARNKPIMMIMASGAVRGKKKASLRDKQKKLRAHLDRAKKG